MNILRLNKASTTSVHFVNDAVLRDSVEKAGVSVMESDLSNVHDADDLFSAVSEAMQFPEYFGGNWDALDECLGDLDWLPNSGFVLLAKGAHKAWSNNPQVMGMFTNCWLEANEYWFEQGIPFHLVFVLPEKDWKE
ncbi:barstar family protein [Salmonella enterica subsp. enterica serovar Agona]|nr:hypothetical protein [Salmonella enterica subsp. enterica serovar Cerro]